MTVSVKPHTNFKKSPKLKKAKAMSSKFGHILSFLSPMGLAVLIGIGLVWSMQQAPVQTVETSPFILWANPGDTLNLSIPILIGSDVKKAVYRVWLTDSDGDLAYQYSDFYVTKRSMLNSIDLRDAHFRLPALPPGRYTIHCKVIYPFNPIKNGVIELTPATVILGTPTSAVQ